MTFKMPGLPRKSTINQFKKLMKKSGIPFFKKVEVD